MTSNSYDYDGKFVPIPLEAGGFYSPKAVLIHRSIMIFTCCLTGKQTESDSKLLRTDVRRSYLVQQVGLAGLIAGTNISVPD